MAAQEATQPTAPKALVPLLWHLVSSFRQRAPPALLCGTLQELGDGVLSGESQQALLTHCLRSPAAALLPTDAEYTRRVLKAVVLSAEQDDQEVSEELMQLYSCCLLGQPSSSSTHGDSLVPAPPPQPGWCYKLYGYAPGGEPAPLTMQRLAALEQQAVQACRQQHPPPPPQQQQQQRQADGSNNYRAHHHQQQQQLQHGQLDYVDRSEALPVATAGDRRHGLLALHVSRNLGEGGTGCHEWEAGFYLAEWVLGHPELVAGRCCLELGCGAGMVGVALHRCGAAHTICTDGNADTVANCRRNLLLNGVPLLGEASVDTSSSVSTLREGSSCEDSGSRQQRTGCRQLCWEDGWSSSSSGGDHAGRLEDEQQGQQQQQPTVVLGADLLYDPTIVPVLLALLKQVLAAASAAGADAGAEDGYRQQQGLRQDQQQPAAYIATTLRNEATLQQFLAAAEADPSICIQQLAGPAALAAAAGTAVAATPGTSGIDAGRPEAAAGPADVEAAAAGIRFQHLPQLDAARSRILLHKITLGKQ